MKIIILGSSGQLGQSLKWYLKKTNYQCFFYNKDNLNISDHKQLHKKLALIKPNIIINACAFTNVDQAEKNFKEANDVNNISVGILAKFCLENNCILIHVSTDYVFDGYSKIFYKEDDQKKPIGAYGKTKLDGEIKILKSGCRYIIFRTSWLFSEFGNNFLLKIINKALQTNEISIITDQIGTPTYACDLSKVIVRILPFVMSGKIISDIFHYSGNLMCSRYDFAKNIIDCALKEGILKKFPTLKPTKSSDYSSLAKRPLYSCLSSEKICNKFSFKSSDWKNGIKQSLKAIKNTIEKL